MLLNSILRIIIEKSFGYPSGIYIYGNYCLRYPDWRDIYLDYYYMGLIFIVIKALVLPTVLYFISKTGLFWYITTVLFYDLMGNLTFFIKGNTIIDIHKIFISSGFQFVGPDNGEYLMLIIYSLYLLIVPLVVFSNFKPPGIQKLYLRSAISMLVFYVLLKVAVFLGLHKWFGRLISKSAWRIKALLSAIQEWAGLPFIPSIKFLYWPIRVYFCPQNSKQNYATDYWMCAQL